MNADRILLGAILVVLIFIGLKLNTIERQMPDRTQPQLQADIDAIQRDVRLLAKKLGAIEPDKPSCYDNATGKWNQACVDLNYPSPLRSR